MDEFLPYLDDEEDPLVEEDIVVQVLYQHHFAGGRIYLKIVQTVNCYGKKMNNR